ncbi:UbiD family decarboxylase [Colletotrichum cuscutae]|uniref:UbiD family decarboxylase n=1 Tax=Colletotrichum cuscutae TaxID=1209917 RepID=A0AAI9XV83_9PEZI|nr:UbiD family decarboxylase [Colletotrichum cuscutae]
MLVTWDRVGLVSGRSRPRPLPPFPSPTIFDSLTVASFTLLFTKSKPVRQWNVTMPRSKTLQAAEKKPIEGNNESQDSQAIFDRYVAEYGIGVLPQHDLDHETPSPALPVVATAADATDPDCGPDSDTIPASLALTRLNIRDHSNCLAADPNPRVDHDAINPIPEEVPASCTTDKTARKVNALPNASGPALYTKVKMDVSQQSPTQDNNDRDYENYYEGPSFVETSPISQDHSAEQPAIHEEDSAVVDFGNLDHLIQGDTQGDTQGDEEPSSFPDHAAPVHTRGAWRNRTSSSQQQSSVQRTDGQSPLLPTVPPPQTPAQRHNPFAGKKLGDPALAGSQLFGQTQFSSAVKHFSPTSSRPSPHVYAHNSISPNIAETSPLKNRYNVTSPPDLLSSSPQALRVQGPAPYDRQRSPSNSAPLEDGTIPESPQMPATNTRGLPEPMGIHESMMESQERKRKSAEVQPELSGEESDDVATKMERRKRAAMKKKAAAQDLTAIPVQRESSNASVEVPSTTRKPRKPPPRRMRYRARRADEDSTASEDEGDGFTVADSQGHATDQQTRARKSPDTVEVGNGTKNGLVSSNDAVPDSAGPTQKSASNGGVPGTESSGNGSRPKDLLIPETSPNNTQSRPEGRDDVPLDVSVDIKKSQQEEEPGAPMIQPNDVEAEVELLPETPEPSLPQPSRRSSRKPKPTLKAQVLKGTNSAVVSSDAAATNVATSPTKEESDERRLSQRNGAQVVDEAIAADVIHAVMNSTVNGEPPMPSSPPLPKAVNGVGPPGTVLSESLAEQGPATPDNRINPAAPTAPGSTTSTLSLLTATPVPSSKSPTASQESVELPPLSPDKSKRGRQPAKALPRLATGSRAPKQGTRKQVRRATRLDSASTDELHRSPSVNGFENSIIQPPKTSVRGSRLSMLSHTSTSKDNTSKPPIFAGMAFAISFQSKKDGEKADHFEQRMGQSREIEKMILQCGGLLLSNGFDELFEPNALGSMTTSPTSETRDENPLTLTPFAQTIGFTALIADGHSRKVKYMQALALGLPCISDRWIATCVSKGTVVDWLPYLLCAGQSTFLRDAIRSRYLAPYPATDARLVDVIERRPKMLDGSQILLVMKRSRAEEKKMPYVFLAHVLGATLSRAHSVDEAKETLRQRELLEDPFGWVYVDEHTGSEEGLFSAVAPASKPSKASKKRKRAAPSTDDAPRPPKRIRTLSNELVIQSLILGRMIEEGEMEV